MTRRASVAAIVAALSLASSTTAQETIPSDADAPRPVLSSDDRWARPALLAVGGLIAAAAVVGPLVWLRARDTVPNAATHEENPADDRH